MFAPKRHASDRLISLLICSLALVSLAGRCPGQTGAATSRPAAFAASGPGLTDSGPGALTAKLDGAMRKELSAGESHQYVINVEANQFLRVNVTQYGLNAQIVLSDPAGKRVAGAGVQNDAEGDLQVSMISDLPGAYKLEVKSLERSTAGSYEVRIAELRTVTAGDRRRIEAERLFLQGEELLTRGEAGPALRAYEGARAAWLEVGDHTLEAATLFRIGKSYNYLGDNQKAVEVYERALRLMPDEAHSSRLRASVLNGIGSTYLDLGDSQKALAYFSQALLLSRKTKDKGGEAYSLYYLGTAYRLAGDNVGALEHLERAMAISRETDDRRLRIYTLQSIGVIYDSVGKESKAKESKALEVLTEALALSREIGDKRAEAWATTRLGRVYAAQGNVPGAIAYYEQALSLSRALGMRDGEAETLYYLGLIYGAVGRVEQSLDCFSSSLALSRAIYDKRTEIKALYEVAKIERRRGALDASRTSIEAALSIADLLHANISLQEPELRSAYFASAQKYYEFYISLLMQLHRERPAQGLDAVALQVSERARARGLMEILTQMRVGSPDGLDPRLLERERSLRQQLAIKTQFQSRLTGSGGTREQAASLTREVEKLTAEFQSVEAQIRIQSPRYTTPAQPSFLSVAEIQTGVLGKDTLLLEYALGEDGSFLWAVTRNSIASYQLPERAVIEAAAREVYELLTEPARSATTRSAGSVQSRPARGEAAYRTASLRLSKMLLGPVSQQLVGKRLILVTQGALQLIPFGALPAPTEAGGPPLVVDHEIVYLPSASLLPALRSEATGRERPAKTLAVIADPVFSKDDPRVSRGPTAGGEGNQFETGKSPVGPVQSATPESTVLAFASHDFPRLPSARWEAERITSLVPPGDSMRAFGFEANRTNATSAALKPYRIVHFATHALVNNRQPELSGILLSSVNEQGTQQDGFLGMNDILNLRLSADLVVLSACSTGLGKDVGGDGIVGLTRAFMYAGAPRVVVSLWNVDDTSTADLMARFYEKMLKEKLEPAAALRAAQIAMWRNGRRQPYYWAGFVLQGADTLNR